MWRLIYCLSSGIRRALARSVRQWSDVLDIRFVAFLIIWAADLDERTSQSCSSQIPLNMCPGRVSRQTADSGR